MISLFFFRIAAWPSSDKRLDLRIIDNDSGMATANEQAREKNFQKNVYEKQAFEFRISI